MSMPQIQIQQRVNIGQQSGVMEATPEKINIDLTNLKGSATLAELEALLKVGRDLNRRIGNEVPAGKTGVSKLRRRNKK